MLVQKVKSTRQAQNKPIKIGTRIAAIAEKDIWRCHNEGIVATVNGAGIIYKSSYDGLYYFTDVWTEIDAYGFPINRKVKRRNALSKNILILIVILFLLFLFGLLQDKYNR